MVYATWLVFACTIWDANAQDQELQMCSDPTNWCSTRGWARSSCRPVRGDDRDHLDHDGIIRIPRFVIRIDQFTFGAW